MSRYGLCGIMKAQPGQRDALLDVLLDAADLVANLPGCEVWIVNTMPDDRMPSGLPRSGAAKQITPRHSPVMM